MAGGAPIGIYPSPIWGPGGTGPAQWDLFTAGSQIWPGKVLIRGATRAYRWDVKDPPGKDGEWVTYRGLRTKPFRIVFLLWTDAHFAFWPAMQLAFQYPESKLGIIAVTNVYHPVLAMLGIANLVTEDVGGVEPVSSDKPDLYTATMVVREYLPPPPVPTTVTPVSLKPPTPPNGPPGLVPSPAVVAAQAAVDQAKAAVAEQAAKYGPLAF